MTKNRPLTTVGTRSFKTLVGQLQWASKQTRPDIAFAACELSTRMKEATTNDVKQSNKQLRKLQSESGIIYIPDLEDTTQTTLILYSDASHASLSNCASQEGFVILLCGKNGKSSPLVWTSHKLKRVVKSSMAAETMSMLEDAEYAVLLKALITEIYAPDDTHIPTTCIIDSKSLIDAIASTKIIEDKHLYIDICSLRDMLSHKEINEVKWTPSVKQLADFLTKGTASPEHLTQVIAGLTTTLVNLYIHVYMELC